MQKYHKYIWMIINRWLLRVAQYIDTTDSAYCLVPRYIVSRKLISYRHIEAVSLLFEIFDFRKVYWSPRFVCLSVCLSVCLFVCLSVRLQRLYRPHRLSDRPNFFSKRCLLDTRQCRTFFFENRIKAKVKVTTLVWNRWWAITIEPEVAETSGRLQNVPYRIPLR